MTAWEEIRGLIARRDAHAVAARIVELDEEARKEVAGLLPGYLKTLRGRRESWEGLDDYAEVLRAAGAGVLTGAAAVATWLNRRDFTSRWSSPYGDTERIMAILATRPAEWRADLAGRLVLAIGDLVRATASPGWNGATVRCAQAGGDHLLFMATKEGRESSPTGWPARVCGAPGVALSPACSTIGASFCTSLPRRRTTWRPRPS
ncbi:hypothetical protein OIE13_19430 [Streptosporangium sp. NBC_01810]|uniref:hypothetical protein n=1 Tax=Streptosporangium sp. NBC_01810 TaxID=2975951 RepID=UPI002DD9316B|nr:hypothetical protein [Streptosporangium sp. NBC_01810]WSA23145.1 hypothetical protein OIE13_19430 [Streptosporangium sp. NBC_01810]